MMFVKLSALILIGWLAVSFGAKSSAHTFHTSLTRIDYNEKAKIFEISMQLFAHDLVPLIEKRGGGKRVEFEKSAEADKLILGYVNENFVLSDKNGTAKTLRWVGKEFDVDTIEVYLEADATETLAGYHLKNTLFFADFPEQTNIVVCRYDGVKADLLFKVGDKAKEIVENKLPSEK
ncbi:MAG: hypothetical protein M3T96_01740 [Acidobacteriota bacterium]|nr:hypothetical protein [Acidobacteriota bacterium]